MVYITIMEIFLHAMLVSIPTVLLLLVFRMYSATEDRAVVLYALFTTLTITLSVLFLFLRRIDPPEDQSRTRDMAQIPITIVSAVIISASIYIFMKYDPHWFYINHQMFLYITVLFVIIMVAVSIDGFVHPKNYRGTPRSWKEKLGESLFAGFGLWLGESCGAVFLLVASILRHKLMHDFSSHAWIRQLCVVGGILLQIGVNYALSELFTWINEVGIAGITKLLDSTPPPPETQNGFPKMVGKMRDWMGYISSYYLAFAKKLLITSLQGPVEALFSSLLMAIAEVCDTLFFFQRATRKVDLMKKAHEEGSTQEGTSCGYLTCFCPQGAHDVLEDSLELTEEEEVKSKELSEEEALPLEEKQMAEINLSREKVVLLAVKYMSTMMLEYVVIFLVVVAAMIFQNDKLVTGLSQEYWSVPTGALFLLFQFGPEAVSDIIGLIILSRLGVNFRELFDEIHNDIVILAVKACAGACIMPLVILCALEREWG